MKLASILQNAITFLYFKQKDSKFTEYQRNVNVILQNKFISLYGETELIYY